MDVIYSMTWRSNSRKKKGPGYELQALRPGAEFRTSKKSDLPERHPRERNLFVEAEVAVDKATRVLASESWKSEQKKREKK